MVRKNNFCSLVYSIKPVQPVQPNLNTGSTRIEPKPDEKPVYWTRVRIDRFQLALGLTDSNSDFSFNDCRLLSVYGLEVSNRRKRRRKQRKTRKLILKAVFENKNIYKIKTYLKSYPM